MQRQDRRNRRARSELDLKGMVQKPTNSASPSRKNSLTRAVDSFNNLRTAAAAVWPDRRHLRPTWKQVRGALLTWGEVWAIVKVLGLLVASPVVAGPALPLLYGLVASPVPAALCACALAWHLHYYFLRSSYTPRLYTGGTKGLLKGRLLSACPALARRVFPPFLWVDEHLQMVPFFATGLMQVRGAAALLLSLLLLLRCCCRCYCSSRHGLLPTLRLLVLLLLLLLLLTTHYLPQLNSLTHSPSSSSCRTAPSSSRGSRCRRRTARS